MKKGKQDNDLLRCELEVDLIHVHVRKRFGNTKKNVLLVFSSRVKTYQSHFSPTRYFCINVFAVAVEKYLHLVHPDVLEFSIFTVSYGKEVFSLEKDVFVEVYWIEEQGRGGFRSTKRTLPQVFRKLCSLLMFC